MKRIFYIALTLVILGGFIAWTGTLSSNSTCPEETSTTDDCTFIGHKITNATGTDLGTVKNVIVDMKDGHPVYAIVSFDDSAFSGQAAMIALKNKIVPIPWEALTFEPTQGAILLDADEVRLANAPHLDDVSHGINGKLDAQIQQYWSETGDGEPCCPCRWCDVWN